GDPQEAVLKNSIRPVAELVIDESLPGVKARKSPCLLIDSLYELFRLCQSHSAFSRVGFKIQHEQVVRSRIYRVEEVVHLVLRIGKPRNPDTFLRKAFGPHSRCGPLPSRSRRWRPRACRCRRPQTAGSTSLRLGATTDSSCRADGAPRFELRPRLRNGVQPGP